MSLLGEEISTLLMDLLYDRSAYNGAFAIEK